MMIWLLPACQSDNAAGEQSGAAAPQSSTGTSASIDPEDFPPGSFGERLAAALQQPSPQGEIFDLRQLKFSEDGVTFAGDSDLSELNDLARIMRAYPNLVVEVGVFAGTAPEGVQNLERFATSRSYFIKNHLINEGVSKVNIETKGFEANDYNTKADQAADRVEIRILGI